MIDATVIYESPVRELDTADINTPESRLWLMRMCVGEGGEECTREHCSALLHSLLNRYLLHKWREAWKKNFIGFVRAFSQPINPRWQTGGDLANQHVNKKSGSPAALRRRKRICSLSIDKIPGVIEDAVIDFIHGALELPEIITRLERPRISNWAATTRHLKKSYPQGVEIGDNWFLEDDQLEEGDIVIKKKYDEDDQQEDGDIVIEKKYDIDLAAFTSEQLLKELLRREAP